MPKSGNYELTLQRKQRWVRSRTKKRKKQAARDRKNRRDRETNIEYSLKRQGEAPRHVVSMSMRDKLDIITRGRYKNG